MIETLIAAHLILFLLEEQGSVENDQPFCFCPLFPYLLKIIEGIVLSLIYSSLNGKLWKIESVHQLLHCMFMPSVRYIAKLSFCIMDPLSGLFILRFLGLHDKCNQRGGSLELSFP